MSKIQEALGKIFEEHRIVFWYDENKELIEQFENISLDKVEKIHVQNNAFEVKFRVARQQAGQAYLLYFSHARPELTDNWLLDLELANYVFHTDQASLFVQDFGLDFDKKEIIEKHIEFFASKERRTKFKKQVLPGDDDRNLKYKMLSIVLQTNRIDLNGLLLAHAESISSKKVEQVDKELDRYKLKDFYWKEIANHYNYLNEEPSIYDFLMEIFSANSALVERTENKLSGESRLFLSLWKDAISYQQVFRDLSDRIAVDLDVENKLNELELEDVLSGNLFRLTDLRIISDLSHRIVEQNIKEDQLAKIVKQRQNKYWYSDFKNYYICLDHASQLIGELKKYKKLTFTSFHEGIKNYAGELSQVDYHYRKFIYHYRQTNQNRVLEPLADRIYKVYSNDWLIEMNNSWQNLLDKQENWPSDLKSNNSHFFNTMVEPYLKKKQRVFVIVSDAFRYECAGELMQNIQNENRFAGELDYMFTGLPSYTQLGMSALMPHRELAFANNSDSVLIDGMSSQGIAGRTKILQKSSGVRGTAVNAEEFMRMNAATDGREFVKQYDLIYIFHNRIDKVGDDKTSEDKVFEAAEQEIDYLLDVVKKIGNMNGNHVLITADHGFIYQHHKIEESDYLSAKVEGDIWKESRRFVIGQNLQNNKSSMHFTSDQIGLKGEAEILIPKSINRLRIKGSGSRFIHGGASLQEIVIPLIKVSRKREDTTSQVEVDIIKSTDTITTNILPVSFIQTDLASEKVLARKIRAALYAEDGTQISDQFTYLFDINEGSERQREVKYRFHLSSVASSTYKGQRIKLILEEPIDASTKWKKYKEFFYSLNISFTNDFDF
jgi:uncharacterized protein (TIGR02687 family)